MQLETHIAVDKLHHAYGLEGDRGDLLESLLSFIELKLNTKRSGNPDLSIHTTDVWYIEDSLKLREEASLSALGNGRRIFIVSFNAIGGEAQNALLKLLEEPAPNAYFFIIVPSYDILLPTVRSRLFLIRTPKNQAEHGFESSAKKFITAPVGERLKMVEPIIKRASDDKTKPEAVAEARRFAHSILVELQKKLETQKEIPRGLEAAARADGYLNDRSPSIRMLLEYLAIEV